jgi:hypothetical protein
MKGITTCVLLAVVLLFIGSCKKDENAGPMPDSNSMLFGLWQNELAIQTEYDNQNHVISEDTLIFTDVNGDPVTLYEEYKSPDELRMISNLTDTISTFTFHTYGSNLVIDVPDSNYVFNNRTIITLNDSVLTMFEVISMNPKVKWTQTFRRQ